MVELVEAYHALSEALSGSSEPEETSSVYHYTSTQVLDKILSTACFWASNIYYLNDAQEYLEGLNRLTDIIKSSDSPNKTMLECLQELRTEAPGTWEGLYTISFSLQSDSLQNWITYAKESGVCIELDWQIMTDENSDLLLKERARCGDVIRPISCTRCLHRIRYSENLTYKEICSAFISCYAAAKDKAKTETEEFPWDANRSYLKRFLQLLASYHKQSGFDGEKEMRLSFFPLSADEDLSNCLDSKQNEAEIKYFRQNNGVLRPYLEIYFYCMTHDKNVCPITGITVGPGGHQQTVFDSIVHRLQYGICKLWEYDRDKKASLLKHYLEGCLNTQEGTTVKPEELTRALAEEWAARAGYSVLTCDVNVEKTVTVELGDRFDSLNPYHPRESIKNTLAKLSREHYLSPQGIWVKKSKIPYIF